MKEFETFEGSNPEQKGEEISRKIKELLKCSVDITEDDLPPEKRDKKVKLSQETPLQAARRQEYERVLSTAVRVLEERLSQGEGTAKATIQETFADGRITEATTDKYLDLIPSEEGGRLIMVTDLHGEPKALEKALELFFEDDHVHLASLGDAVAGGGAEQLRILEALVKLYTKYPDRVHLLRGNCESAVFPAEGAGGALYESMGDRGFIRGRGAAQRLFGKLPVGVVTENGVSAVHAALPHPTQDNGQAHYRNLMEINELDNYYGDVALPIWVRGRDEFKERREEALRPGATAGMKTMLWGDINTDEEEGYRSPRGFVASRPDILKQQAAIGTTVTFRGHQSKLLKGSAQEAIIGPDENIATFHSSGKGGKIIPTIATVPLDQPVERITEDMFTKVE